MIVKCAGICAVICLTLNTANAKPVITESIEVAPLTGNVPLSIPVEDFAPRAPLPDALDLEAEQPNASKPTGDAPQVLYDTSLLPKPVKRMHTQMREVALSGDIERLRIILESNEVPPTLSLTEIGDPIDFLKESSGDGQGYEILAILADVLEAGFVHVDAGTPQEMYVWPYFARYPLHELRPDQKVELFRIVTSGDFTEMQDFGAWLFYRVGIGPDGTLHYFVAGD